MAVPERVRLPALLGDQGVVPRGAAARRVRVVRPPGVVDGGNALPQDAQALAHVVRGESLTGFVQSTVAPGSSGLTDGCASYEGTPVAGMEHYPIVRASAVDGHQLLPAVHRVAALLHRVLLGTYQGAVRPKHLAAYLTEFEFRFNRRFARSRTLLFQRALSCAVATRPPECCRIIGRTSARKPIKKAA